MKNETFFHLENKLIEATSAIRSANQELTCIPSEAVVRLCEVRLKAKVLQEKLSLFIERLSPLSVS